MKEPTEEEKRKLWEWCGFKYSDEWSAITPYKDPQGEIVNVFPLDLNNLFRWAVLRLPKAGAMRFILLHKWVDSLIETDVDPALALFWAIWPLMEGK